MAIDQPDPRPGLLARAQLHEPGFAAATIAFRRPRALLGGAGPLALPIAVTVAIVRHRLYDIDRVLNRTLV